MPPQCKKCGAPTAEIHPIETKVWHDRKRSKWQCTNCKAVTWRTPGAHDDAD